MLVVVGAASRPKTLGNSCERDGQENGEVNCAGAGALERFRLPEGARKPVEEHDRRAFARKLSVDELEHETVGYESASFKERMHFET